jgi:GxxExxY protein
MEIVFKDESYAIMGACFEVYKDMGCGFLEAVYQECLGLEFGFQDVPFREQEELELAYKQNTLSQKYVPDFICYDKIIVEIKAVTQFDDTHRAQVHNYLKSTGYKLGLLINFEHHPKAEWESIVR